MQQNNIRKGSYRYRILALVLLATTINYLDRSIIGVLGPTLQYKVFSWSDGDYAAIMMAFKFGYAVGLLLMGSFIDRYGTRIGYSVSIVAWTIFGMLHALIRPGFSVIGFIAGRFGFAFGEAGNYPAAAKTVAEWFPKRERALAVGIFNTGANFGPILAPLVVAMVVMVDGTNWQFAFLCTAAFSILWLFLWLRNYRKPGEHPALGKAELDYINSDSASESDEKLPWKKLFPLRQTWAFSAGKISDAVWWFYIFWGAKFLFDKFGLNIKELALPLIVIYSIVNIGSIFGGWISSRLIQTGRSINMARKSTMLGSALVILPVVFVTMLPTSFVVDSDLYNALEGSNYRVTEMVETDGKRSSQRVDKPFPPEVIESLRALDGKTYTSARDFSIDLEPLIGTEKLRTLEPLIHSHSRTNNYYWIAVLLIALAASGHASWMANLYAMATDIFPRKGVASVAGIGGMVGAVAGIAADWGLGQVLTTSGTTGYFIAFLIAGLIYLLLLGIIHLLIPRLQVLGEDLKPV